ncbi:MAG: hypothetical protein RR766_08680, partial [Longicatena sp.]
MAKNIGKIVQVIGPVVDIRYASGVLPALKNAIDVLKENNEKLAVVVAGGNGAGKSTFINHQLLPLYKTTGINYINADDWQKKH